MLLSSGFSAIAGDPGRGGAVKVRASREAASRLLERGGDLVADYGSFVLVEVPSLSFSDQPGADPRPHENIVWLSAGPIDTTQPEAHAVRVSELAPAGRVLHLVQFAGPPRHAWLDELKATGARVVTYIPSNTYLVYGNSGAIASIRNLAAASRHIQWEAPYADGYKFAGHSPARAKADAPQDARPGAQQEAADLYAIQLVDDPAVNPATLQVIDQFTSAPVHKSWRVLDYFNLIVKLPADSLAALAARPDVVSIRPYLRPTRRDERQNQIIAGNLAGSGPAGPGYLDWLASWGFTQAQFDASGFLVDVTDSGLDNGTSLPHHFGLYVAGTLPGTSRVGYNRLEGTPNPGSTIAGCDGHGTINAHIIGGYSDLSGPPFADASGFRHGLGVVPFVRLGSSVIFDPDNYTFPNFANLQSKAYADSARISSNSWGADNFGGYDVDAQTYDALVRDAQPAGSTFAAPGNQEMVIVFANGNDGPGIGTVGTPATAKNVISVGAAENVHPFGGWDNCLVDDNGANSANDIISFSSRGPTADGRNKPDLVAPGTHVTGGVFQQSSPGPTGSADPCFSGEGVCGGVSPSNFFPSGQQFYTASSGTSHSCPAVAGGAALLRQFFLNLGMNAPSPAMTKALLINSARYLNGVATGDTLWSSTQGMGEMNLGEAFARGVTPTLFRDQDQADLFTATGQSRVHTASVADESKPLRVTLAWTDAPGSTSGAAYRNDLDLLVTMDGVTYKGNVFAGSTSVAGGSADPRNNVESVFLPAGISGNFAVQVLAASINSDGVPGMGGPLDQDFALVVYNASAASLPVAVAGAGTVAEENCLPANDAIDPGETVTLELSLQNIGTADTSNLTAELLTGGGVSNPGAPQNYGALLAGGPAVNMPFTFTASGACGSNITARLKLTDNGSDLGHAAFTFLLGGVVSLLEESFDTVSPPDLPPGWSVTTSGYLVPWATTNTVRDSLPNSIFAPDPPGITDNALISPAIPIATTAAKLTFRHRYILENSYDGAVLEIAVGGGAFADIASAGGTMTAGGYDRVISTCCGNPLSGRAAWSGSSGGFVTTAVTLPASAAGQTVRLRWRLGADYSVPGTGWHVDTITLTEVSCCECVDPPPPTGLLASPASVCPGGPVTLSGTPGPGGVTIDWFTTPDCSGLPLTSGPEVQVNPVATTDYYARTRSAMGCSSACAGPATVTVNPPAACMRSIIGWRSVRTHAGLGALPVPLDPAATGNGPAGPAVEPRLGGIQLIQVVFDQPMTLIEPASISVSGSVTSSGLPGEPGPYPPNSVAMTSADTLAITFAPGALPDTACYTITLAPGTFAETLTGDTDVVVRSLQGDTTQSGALTLSDALLTGSKVGSAVADAPWLDLDLSGDVGNSDLLAAKSRVVSPMQEALCP